MSRQTRSTRRWVVAGVSAGLPLALPALTLAPAIETQPYSVQFVPTGGLPPYPFFLDGGGPSFTLYPPAEQLDATAYPGNSGSPLYDPASGTVLGIINMGLVKGTKESAITNPSGITYAVPAHFIHALLQRPSP